MPTYRYIFMSESVNGKVYVIGGHGTVDDGPWESGKGWEYKSNIDIYDPANDTWSFGEEAPSTLARSASCANDGKIYILGGKTSSPSAKTFQYDTSTDAWSEKAQAPTARSRYSCISVGDNFYAIGGVNSPQALNIMERYSTKTDSWENAGTLPTARYSTTANLINDKIYIMGGIGDEHQLLDIVEVMDTSIQDN